MKNDNLKSLFEGLQGEFDFENPDLGHQHRFLAKLQKQDQVSVHPEVIRSNRSWWKPLTAVAASVALLVSVFVIMPQEQEISDLASVSPEMSQTQDFFTIAIAEELKKLESERAPETESLVNDALTRMEALEAEYEVLKVDLTESGDDQRVIHAMIANFQSRIDLLQSVLDNIEIIKQLKQDTNENSTTL